MSIIQSIILGLIQGLTEFIPVSSSGHLYLVPQILGWQTPSTIFITVVDWGTLIALIFFYRFTIARYLKEIYNFIFKKNKSDTKVNSDLKTIGNIIIATIPAGIIGLGVEKIISSFYDNPGRSSNLSLLLTVAAMIIVGLIFILTDKYFKNNQITLERLTKKNALLIGVAQALAFIRGVSRSGITLIATQGSGLKTLDSAEFSFLMSIPIIGISTLYETLKLFSLPENELGNELVPAVIGSIFALVSGIMAIKFMLNYLKSKGLKLFGYYRIAFGVILLLIILL